jgi:hypothetical protein
MLQHLSQLWLRKKSGNTAVSLTAKVPTPPWRRTELQGLICDIPGIVDKQLQTPAERKSIAVKYIADNYPHAQ